MIFLDLKYQKISQPAILFPLSSCRFSHQSKSWRIFTHRCWQPL